MRTTCSVVSLRRSDIQKQRRLATIRDNIFLSICGEMKHCWGRNVWAPCCFMMDRSDVALFRFGACQLSEARGARKVADAPCAP
jgi:hypothetical protein